MYRSIDKQVEWFVQMKSYLVYFEWDKSVDTMTDKRCFKSTVYIIFDLEFSIERANCAEWMEGRRLFS